MTDDKLLDWDKFGEYNEVAIPNRMVSYIDQRHKKTIIIVFRNGTIWKAETPLKETLS